MRAPKGVPKLKTTSFNLIESVGGYRNLGNEYDRPRTPDACFHRIGWFLHGLWLVCGVGIGFPLVQNVTKSLPALGESFES